MSRSGKPEEGEVVGDGISDSRAKNARNSDAYKKARSRAEQYAGDPDKLNDLIEKASKKASGRKGRLDAVWTRLMVCFRLVRAYARGTYRQVPSSTLVMLVAAIIYFVMPIDLLPDFILGLGLMDDVALLGWTLRTFSSEIDAFEVWESEQSV